MTLTCGTRDSALSLLQTNDALAKLRDETGLDFKVVPFSSPGDRDQATDLRVSPGDFFTRDLDQALLEGRIDCAIHSAKDLPPEMEVHRPPVGVNVKDIGYRFAGKDEKFPAFKKSDGHCGSLRC